MDDGGGAASADTNARECVSHLPRHPNWVL